MKMGLWESKGIVSPGAPIKDTPANHERIMRNCTTPDNWLKMMGPNGPGTCPKINEAWTKDTYSFDVQCSGKPKMASVSVHFIDPETDHVILDMFGTPSGDAKVHQEIDAKWISEACGDVTPGHPVLVR